MGDAHAIGATRGVQVLHLADARDNAHHIEHVALVTHVGEQVILDLRVAPREMVLCAFLEARGREATDAASRHDEVVLLPGVTRASPAMAISHGVRDIEGSRMGTAQAGERRG